MMRLILVTVVSATLLSQGGVAQTPAVAPLEGAIEASVEAAATSSNQASQANEEHQGKITGRVTNAAGQPLAGIEVHARHGSSPRLTVATDAQGYFEFTSLETTAYSVTVEDESYLSEAWDNHYCGEGCSAGNRVGVVSPETTAGIDFRLERPASIVVTGIEDYRTNVRVFDVFG